MSGSETERIAFLDAARGVGILLVAVTHAIIPAMREASPFLMGFWNVTYAFHITIFFLVSGFCYELGLTRHPQSSFLSYAAQRARRLLVPYLVYSVLVYLVIDLASLIPSLSDFLARNGYGYTKPLEAMVQILKIQPHIDKHLWFLPCLFFVELFSRASGKQGSRGWLLGLLLAVNLLPITLGPLEYFRTALGYTVAYTLGRTLATLRRQAVQKNGWIALGAAAIFAVCYTGRNTLFSVLSVYSPLGRSLFALIGYACSLSGAVAVLALSAAVLYKMKSLVALGRLSFPIYLFHQPFFTSGAAGILFILLGVPWPVSILLASLAGMGLSIVACRIVEKNKISACLFLGKPLSAYAGQARHGKETKGQ